MRSVLFSTAALCAALATSARAEGVAAVDELVVTSTRLPSDPQLVTGARVIDRAEIEARQAVFLTDVLASVPGVGVARNGAFGGVASVRLRGVGADKTLVLVDGVPLNDPSDPNGAYDFSTLQLADVERVEVLSGPQGSLWGSEAIGGVIALTTRELDGWRLDAEGGSFDTARAFAGAGISREAYGFGASVSGFRTDGISKADRRYGQTEKDGFETVAANLDGRVKLSQAVRLDGRVRYTAAEVDLDGYPFPSFLLSDTPDTSRSRAWSGVGRVVVDGPWGVTHTLSLSAYDLTRKNISDFPSRYEANRQVWRWTAEKGAAGDALAFAGGVEHDDTEADLDGRAKQDLGATSVFAVVRARAAERLTATASLRYDDPDQFKSRTTGRLSAALEAGAGFTVTASAGQGFKTPTISQAACDFCFAPPVPLVPEKAEGYDLRLGWRAPDGGFDAALTGYRLIVRDQISYAGLRYVNIARTRSAGLEAEARVRLTDRLTAKLAYAYVDAVDRSTGASLLRVPDHSGSAALFWTDAKWSGALTVRGESSQTDTARDGFTPVRRPAFATADVAGSYALSERVTLTARIENLADARYQETFGYGEPGRAAYVGVRLRN